MARIDYPWIAVREPKLEALLSNYYDIACDYSVSDYRAQVCEEPIVASVACEFGAADGVAEARWIQDCADHLNGPQAFIAAAAVDSPRLPDVLARYRDLPVVRAARQPLYWTLDPIRRLGARGDYLADSGWWRGFEKVAESGLVWDLLVYDEQLAGTHELIRSFPETIFVLEAAGWPLDCSDDGFARWKDRMWAVSQFPNVVLKLQGLALLFGPTRQAMQRWVSAAIQMFGADRCMFATHWPVDALLWDIRELVATLCVVLDDLPPEQQAEFFGGTACRVYGLELVSPAPRP